MSKANIIAFYQLLEADKKLQQKALSFQKEFQEQEKVIDAFLALAESVGYPFSYREFMEHMYEQAKEME